MITIDDVASVAKFSKFKLSEEEKDKFRSQLEKILEIIQDLNSLDTEGIIPLYSPLAVNNRFREDKVEDCDIKKDIINSSGFAEDNRIVVPKVV